MNKYTIYNKNSSSPIIVSLPHSGTFVPDDIRKKFNEDIVLDSTDWFLPELYDFIKVIGLTMIVNNLNRYVIDVNRKIDRKDTLSYKTNLVFHKNSHGSLIYKHDLSRKDIEERIKFYYEPYHNALKNLIDDKLKKFKTVYLIDLHSYYLADEDNDKVLISNNKGLSSSKESFDLICSEFINEGFNVLRNEIFTGGHITKSYSEKYKGKVNCIQVELPYRIYIEDREFFEEEVKVYNEELFNKCQDKLNKIFAGINSYII